MGVACYYNSSLDVENPTWEYLGECTMNVNQEKNQGWVTDGTQPKEEDAVNDCVWITKHDGEVIKAVWCHTWGAPWKRIELIEEPTPKPYVPPKPVPDMTEIGELTRINGRLKTAIQHRDGEIEELQRRIAELESQRQMDAKTDPGERCANCGCDMSSLTDWDCIKYGLEFCSTTCAASHHRHIKPIPEPHVSPKPKRRKLAFYEEALERIDDPNQEVLLRSTERRVIEGEVIFQEVLPTDPTPEAIDKLLQKIASLEEKNLILVKERDRLADKLREVSIAINS